MVTLSEATIKAQQALSEKFGIPTFDLTGGLSTVPKNRTLSRINVGTGKFTGETLQSFTNTLKQNINTVKLTGGSIGNTSFSAPKTSNKGGENTGDTQPKDSTSFEASEVFNQGFSQAGAFFTDNPGLLIAGLAVVGILLIKR